MVHSLPCLYCAFRFSPEQVSCVLYGDNLSGNPEVVVVLLLLLLLLLLALLLLLLLCSCLMVVVLLLLLVMTFLLSSRDREKVKVLDTWDYT